MKHLIFTIMLFAATVTAAAQTKDIAHRGFWTGENSAQNSLIALYNANQIGCFGSEFDVHRTSDGQFVVYHDNDMNGKKIMDTPFAELRDYVLKNGEILPTLEQYLVHARNCPATKLILEIKTGKQDPKIIQQTVAGIIALVDKYNLQPRTEYIAFSLDICKELIRVRPEAPVHYLNGDLTPEQLKELNFTGLDYHHSKFVENPNLVQQAKKLGLKTNVWTVNDPEMMRKFLEMGIDFITTDQPIMLQQCIDEYQTAK